MDKNLLQAEVDLMNRLLLTFIDVEDLVRTVTDNLTKELNDEPYRFTANEEDVEIIVTPEDIDRHTETAFQDIYDWDDNIPTIVYTTVHEKIDGKEIESIADEVEQDIKDQKEFLRDPLGYVGLSERDFI